MAILHSRIPRDFSDSETKRDIFEESDEGGVQMASLPIFAYNDLQAWEPDTDTNDGSIRPILGDISGDGFFEESAEGGIQIKY